VHIGLHTYIKDNITVQCSFSVSKENRTHKVNTNGTDVALGVCIILQQRHAVGQFNDRKPIFHKVV